MLGWGHLAARLIMAAARHNLQHLAPHVTDVGFGPYGLQNRLTDIFEEHISVETAKTKIKKWIVSVAKSGLRCFDSFINTLGHWWNEILNYFVARETSGFVEGFNNKIKVLKRRCYGITNVAHLFQRIYLDLEGYRLFA